MKYKLSKLIGRNQLPGDEIAFKRLAAAFGEAPPILNTQRRQRVMLPNGRSKPDKK